MGDVQVTIRLPADALARIDKLVHSASQSGNPLIARLSRSQMMRAVVEFGIDQAERQYAALLSTSDSPSNRLKSAPRRKAHRGGI